MGELAGILGGATAAGKSEIALRLARRNGFAVVSADSRQVYRGLAAGTNQPAGETLANTPHHLVGHLPPEQRLSPRQWALSARAVLENSPLPCLVVGGSGLYLKELLYPAREERGDTPETIRKAARDKAEREGWDALYREVCRRDPQAASKVHANDRFRILKLWENLAFTGQSYLRFASAPVPDARYARAPLLYVDLPREALYRRIDERVPDMLRKGWPEEARDLLRRNSRMDWPAWSALGYRELAAFARGEMDWDEAVRRIRRATRRYAKKQRTFFRHQFPTAVFCDRERLVAALDSCDWDWRRFVEAALPGLRAEHAAVPPGASGDPKKGPSDGASEQASEGAPEGASEGALNDEPDGSSQGSREFRGP